jgi:hypothetical protein
MSDMPNPIHSGQLHGPVVALGGATARVRSGLAERGLLPVIVQSAAPLYPPRNGAPPDAAP